MKQKGIFVTGTDTNVGKTWVSQQLIAQLSAKKEDVVPRKPIESGWVNVEATDAYALAKAANKLDQLDVICPKRYQAALSPVSAAALEDKVNTLAEGLKDCLTDVSKDQFLYVEGAGGFYSPLYADGLNADLAQQLKLPVLLIADDKLGCINHVLLTIEAIKHRGLTLLAIVLNQTSEKEGGSLMDNQSELQALVASPVISVGYQEVLSDVLSQMLSAVIPE